MLRVTVTDTASNARRAAMVSTQNDDHLAEAVGTEARLMVQALLHDSETYGLLAMAIQTSLLAEPNGLGLTAEQAFSVGQRVARHILNGG